jgi:NHL repeat
MKRSLMFVAAVGALMASFVLGTRMSTVEGEAKPGVGFAAIPGLVGGQDPFGPYEAAQNWPKPISGLPGNEKWTWGAGEGIFAESANRVFVLQRGELPNIPRPKTIDLPQLGPNIEFPIGRLPWRDTTSASPPRTLDGPDGKALTVDTDGSGVNGRDFNWENCLIVVDANGNITERWTQYDKDYRRPHSVFINPYDATKAVWIVDDYRHAIFKYTNDGKQLLQTIGTVNQHASDDKHFYRPTFMAWQADSSFYVADGYANTRVVKFDKDGKYLTAWGEKGTSTAAKPETRPNYFNTVHGVAIDPKTKQVFVNDRNNHRIQVFDENGKFLRMWSTGGAPSDVHLVYMGADRKLWIFDRGTSKAVQYDVDGHLLYAWGTWGDMPGGFWGVHGVSVDQDGNFYSAAVDSGGGQKFIPRPGANPAMMVGKPVKAAW